MNELQNLARDLLTSGTVTMIIGYTQAGSSTRTKPIIVTTPDDADKLVFNRYCLNNLAVYLNRPEFRGKGKVGLVVKGCDARAVVQLIQEHRVTRDDVYLIGVNCNGVVKDFHQEWRPSTAAAKCVSCEVRTPPIYDSLLGTLEELGNLVDAELPRIQALEAKPAAERFQYWLEEFSKCVKCYACRQVCPLCYCTQCIVEKSVPRWIESSAHIRGNFAWNLIRAFHLSGRCIGCGECERACPVDIPLSLLNRKMATVVKEQFEYVPGMDVNHKPWLGTYALEDCEDFIK